MNLAHDVAHDQVAITVAVPVAGKRGRRPADVERFGIGVLELGGRGERALAQAAEPVDFTRPGAGENIERTVTIQIHQLWSEADASPCGTVPVVPPASNQR